MEIHIQYKDGKPINAFLGGDLSPMKLSKGLYIATVAGIDLVHDKECTVVVDGNRYISDQRRTNKKYTGISRMH